MEVQQPTAVTPAKREVDPGFSLLHSVNLVYSPALKSMDPVLLRNCGEACPVCLYLYSDIKGVLSVNLNRKSLCGSKLGNKS